MTLILILVVVAIFVVLLSVRPRRSYYVDVECLAYELRKTVLSIRMIDQEVYDSNPTIRSSINNEARTIARAVADYYRDTHEYLRS